MKIVTEASVIGKRLLDLRTKSKKTGEEVAIACGISRSALTMYETGARIPRDEIKVKLASYYGASVESIFFTP